MKNTLTISTYNPTLLSKTDDGTNRFFIRLRCDLTKSPRIIFSDSTVTPTTSDFLYEVSSSKWLGSGTLSFTVSDSDGSAAYTVEKYSGSTTSANLMMLEDSSYAYHFADVTATGGDYGLSITGRILSIILGGGSPSVELPAGLDGRGIVSIVKTGTQGLVDTYTITYTDSTTSTFTVTNGADGQQGPAGRGISSITKTGTSGLVDTYTITYSDNTTSTFNVTNGKDGADGAPGQDGAPGVGISSVTKTGSAGLVDTYTITYTNGNTSTFTVTNGASGSPGTSAGFGTPTASVDANTGTPSVTVTASGPDTAKVFDFAFHNLKGAPGSNNWSDITGRPSVVTTLSTDTGRGTNTRADEWGVKGPVVDTDGTTYTTPATLAHRMQISNTSNTTYTFTNAYILSDSVIDVYTDTWGDNPSSVTVTRSGGTGTCTVTFAQAKTRTVMIMIYV